MNDEQRVQEALKALYVGDKREARRLLGDVLRTDPDNITAWWYLSEALDDREQKAHCLRQVLRLHPDHTAAQVVLTDLERRSVKVTPPDGLSRPVFDANDQGGILFIPTPIEERPVKFKVSEKHSSKPLFVLGIVVFVILAALLGAGTLFLPKIVQNWPGINVPEPTPTLHPLVFDVQGCTATSQSKTTLVFMNKTDVPIAVSQGQPGQETHLFDLAPGVQETIDVQPGKQIRYAANTDAPGFTSGGATIEVPQGSSCQVPIR
ncbi:MAG: hypothetical protein JXB07_20465 [Anaerolineae bacterium]|nr:hypothetical protein [Anaerolineae bacterium]